MKKANSHIKIIKKLDKPGTHHDRNVEYVPR